MWDKKGQIHFISALLRVGGDGAVVDNYHAGGIAYPTLQEAITAAGEMGCSIAAFDIIRSLYYPGFLLLCSLISIALPGRKKA